MELCNTNLKVKDKSKSKDFTYYTQIFIYWNFNHIINYTKWLTDIKYQIYFSDKVSFNFEICIFNLPLKSSWSNDSLSLLPKADIFVSASILIMVASVAKNWVNHH